MFDEFSPVTIDGKDEFEKYRAILFKSISSENYISDLCFSNLFAWSAAIETYIRVIDDYYCIVARLRGSHHIYAPLGDADPEKYEKIVDHLYERYGTHGRSNEAQRITFTMVPEGLLDTFRKLKKYKPDFVYDPNYSDYTYDNANFVQLIGKSDRYDYRKFLQGRVPKVETIDSRNKHICAELMEKHWCSVNDCVHCYYGCELKALKKLLDNYESLDCLGALLFDNSEPLAFIIAEYLSPGMVGYQFHKAKRNIVGLTRYLYNNFSNIAHKDASYVNFAEDMGIEGLRGFKRQFAPYVQIHKYDVILERKK